MGQDAMEWADAEFRGTPGLNQRLQNRLVRTTAVLATRPHGTLPHRFTWAELKGAYRLVHAANPDTLQDVHRHNTRRRAEEVDTPVLFIHDTTQLDFSTHTAVADQLGPIGDGADGARGFLQHNSLAVDPAGRRLLGLIHQQTFLRTPRPVGETREARRRRATRESRVWIDGVAAVGRAPEGKVWVHVGDRGADCFGMMAMPRQHNAHFLIRLAQNRKAGDPQADDAVVTHLMDAARRVAPITSTTIHVASRGGRPSRWATVQLGVVRLTIRASHADPLWRHEPPVTLTVVRIWEDHPPPDVEPLEWILGTDLEDDSPQALLRYQSWYECRWRTAEEYHKIQKTGCRIEDLRFETVERLQAAIALLSVVAVRILHLRWQRDACPDAPAESVASAEEVAVLQRVRPGRPIVTVRQFVDRVAGLGGYLGRKCDGPPGWQSLWRGYQRLADILLGYACATTSNPPKIKDSG